MQASRPVAVIFALACAFAAWALATKLSEQKTGSCGTAVCHSQEKQAGMTIAAYWPRSYIDPQSSNELLALKKTGASWVAIEISGSQPLYSSTTVSAAHSPLPADVQRFTENAHLLGLKVTWLFDVSLSHDINHGPDEIGQGMTPDQAVEWFQSYRPFVLSYAKAAAKSKVDEISIGSTFRSLDIYSDQWRSLINSLRSHFDGALTYSAYPDEAAAINFWDALDYVGINAFFPLASTDSTPTSSGLVASWRKKLPLLEQISKATHKKILFTSIGYPSLASAAYRPWVLHPGASDPELQNMLYDSFFRTAWTQSFVAGAFFWRFAIGDTAWGYSPYKQPALLTLESAYRQ